MGEQPVSAAGAGGAIFVVPSNTSPTSLSKLMRRIDELPLGARVVLTVTKNDAGVLFWTLTALGSVER